MGFVMGRHGFQKREGAAAHRSASKCAKTID